MEEPAAKALVRCDPELVRAPKRTSLRDPRKVAENNAKQNQRRKAEKNALKEQPATRSQPAEGLAAGPGRTGSVVGAEASYPVAVAKGAACRKPAAASGSERVFGAVADFWERKQAKARLNDS